MESVELYTLEWVWQQLSFRYVGLCGFPMDFEQNAVATAGNQPADELVVVCGLLLSSWR
jgi:hypothetical protein